MAENEGGDSGFIGTLFETVKPFFDFQWKDHWERYIDIIPSIADELHAWFMDFLNGIDDPGWETLIKIGEKSELFSQYQIDFFRQLKELPLPLSVIALINITLTLVIGAVLATYQSSSAHVVHSLNSQTRPTLADPATLVRSAFIAPEKTAEIRDLLAKHGFSDEQMDFLFLSNYALYDPNTCRDLFLRGVIDQNKVFERMREMGFTDTRTSEMMKTWSVIPGVQDLFHLVAREAFEPDQIRLLGLDAEFPEQQVEWLEKQGLSRDWALKYWYAHWEEPSIQMGFEMLHRGVIDIPMLKSLMKTVEIPPFWRDKMIDIAYTPYTRVDTRRMYAQGILSVQDVFTSYTDQGYDHTKAMNMTKFTIADAEVNERDISMSQVLRAFEDGILDRKEAATLLQELGYTETKAEFLIVSKEYDIESKMQALRIGVIKDEYVNRLTNKFDTQAALQKLNLPHKQVELLLDEWDIVIYKGKKLPSKSDLAKFLKKGIVDKGIYLEEMEKLGYSDKYAGWYLKSLDDKQ